MKRSSVQIVNRLLLSRIVSCSTIDGLASSKISTFANQETRFIPPWMAALAISGVGAGLGWQYLNTSTDCLAPSALPEYSQEEVARHKDKQSRIWVTYKDGVYDVTDWADIHPGGADKLMLAAGGAIDPYWAMYQQHNTDAVRDILEEYRIGRIKGGPMSATAQIIDPYENDPKDRLPALVVRSQKPMNAETPLQVLAGAFITPTQLFYIRNHLPVPVVDSKEWRLTVQGEGVRSVELSLNDLRTQFKRHEITATMQCTGNRRNEYNDVKKVKGLEWEGGSIGNAQWAGVRLRDVLISAGLSYHDSNVSHVQFEGLDSDGQGQYYGASIPLNKAMDTFGDVLLAYEMNGEPLTRDHGAPVRILAPGVAGCRSVKWLGKITTSDKESASFWQQKDYKTFNPSIDWDSVEWEKSPAIQSMPVTSLICEPAQGSTIDDDEVSVKGYAWSGGGNSIIRVDVSADGGATWHEASLTKEAAKPGRGWSWALWQATIPLPKDCKGKEMTLVCKAVDESCNTQPESAGPIWNLRGVNCNSWHRVNIKIV